MLSKLSNANVGRTALVPFKQSNAQVLYRLLSSAMTIGNGQQSFHFKEMDQFFKHNNYQLVNKNQNRTLKEVDRRVKLSTASSNWAALADVFDNDKHKISADGASLDPVTQEVYDRIRMFELVTAYQNYGHLHADTDPLQLPKESPYVTTTYAKVKSVKPSYKDYGFTDTDLDKTFKCHITGATGFLSMTQKPMTLRHLVQRLEDIYCGHIAVELTHIRDENARNFLLEKFETLEKGEFSDHMKRRILARTLRAQLFENFCAQKFSTSKRFGADGCETMIVAMKEISKRAACNGVDSIVIGMSHRGRLNVLMNTMHKPMPMIMNEFKGLTGFGKEDWGSLGDVKYHLGVDFDLLEGDSQRQIHMSLLANPSHLESVDAVVCGQARAQQYFLGDKSRKKVLPVIFHGDASFAGQGVVYETLQMSELPMYCVGGTIHIIVNNQIGFTANVVDGGSGVTCASLARAIDSPIFHVNADDPEAVTRVGQIAYDYRHKFGTDVFINLIGYRRFGHNELDMAKFTQPAMYNRIEAHKPVLHLYLEKLKKEGVIDQQHFDDTKKTSIDFYNKQYEVSKTYDGGQSMYEYTPQWKTMHRPTDISPPRLTGWELNSFTALGNEVSTLPKAMEAHPTIKKLYNTRLEAIKSGVGVDFGLAETLAYATLLKEGYHVRLSGQDAQRGTFSHRHSVVHNQNESSTLKEYCPLANIVDARHTFEVCNSLLSEYAVLGFEFGYSLENPDALVIWEAQFGDFANGAQIIIDQYIASGEVKWGRQCGITLLLPHGYDGQGPEHSSARIERFLQLCDDREDVIHPENWDIQKRSVIQKHNIQVVMPSTPANHFHVLRRQMIRGFRKPLIVFSPKKLLKLRAAVSDLKDMGEGTRFQRYLPDTNKNLAAKDKVKRLIVCSGQLYYDLAAYRHTKGFYDVAISRIEQLSPFPFDMFIDDLKSYPNVENVIWAQEEPMNAGPWPYVSMRIQSALTYMGNPKGIQLPIYIGRDVSAAPAVGDMKLHEKELNLILESAFHRNQNVYYEKYMSKK